MCRCYKQDDHHNNADHGGDVDNYEAPINLEVDYVVIFEGSELFAVQDFSAQYFAKTVSQSKMPGQTSKYLNCDI